MPNLYVVGNEAINNELDAVQQANMQYLSVLCSAILLVEDRGEEIVLFAAFKLACDRFELDPIEIFEGVGHLGHWGIAMPQYEEKLERLREAIA